MWVLGLTTNCKMFILFSREVLYAYLVQAMDTKTHDLNLQMLMCQPLKLCFYYVRLTCVPTYTRMQVPTEALEMGLPEVVGRLKWVLGTEFQSPVRVLSLLNHLSSPLNLHLKTKNKKPETIPKYWSWDHWHIQWRMLAPGFLLFVVAVLSLGN